MLFSRFNRKTAEYAQKFTIKILIERLDGIVGRKLECVQISSRHTRFAHIFKLLGFAGQRDKGLELLLIELVFYGLCDVDECVVDVEIGLGRCFDVLDAIGLGKLFAVVFAYLALGRVSEITFICNQIDLDVVICVVGDRLHPHSDIVEGLLIFHIVHKQNTMDTAIVVFYY
jgi:hypothetical protein